MTESVTAPGSAAPGADPIPTLSLVLPAYNEQGRLPTTLAHLRQFLKVWPEPVEVLVVDNGSRDATAQVVREALPSFPVLRLLNSGHGKGQAVRTGMLAARGAVRVFGDADLSWDLADLHRFFDLVAAGQPVVIGSREGFGARRVGEPPYRHVMGRVFNRLVQALAVPGIEDTQCGFKAFSADAARAIFERQTIGGFGFDVEVLFLARYLGYPVLAVPLRWEHKENSRVAPIRDTLKMVWDVLTVRANALRGRYGPSQAHPIPPA